MADPRALVRNAGDPEQVRRAARKVHDRERRFADGLRASLKHPEVRFVFAEILERAGIFKSVFDHSGSVMYFNEGQRQFGLKLWTWLEDADEQQAELMEQERRARRRADNREVDAIHNARATEEQTT